MEKNKNDIKILRGMVEISELKKEVKRFRDERDWKKYHTQKNLALSVSIEAAELLELFQWKEEESDEVSIDRLEEEMADVMIYLLALAERAEIDLGEAVLEKLERNRKKYPAEEEHFS